MGSADGKTSFTLGPSFSQSILKPLWPEKNARKDAKVWRSTATVTPNCPAVKWIYSLNPSFNYSTEAAYFSVMYFK